MVVAKTKYLKKFTSKTDQGDISRHGSPYYEDYQTINKKDEQIRKEIDEKFVLEEYKNLLPHKQGFDGQILYVFWTEDDLFNKKESDKSKNIEYITTVNIMKSGKESTLYDLCDLERYLMNQGFTAQNN